MNCWELKYVSVLYMGVKIELITISIHSNTVTLTSWQYINPISELVLLLLLLLLLLCHIFSPHLHRQKEWSNQFFPFLWPPQMCLFWFQKSFQILKKIQKWPLLHPKLEKSKKDLFKGRRSGQINFFLFFQKIQKRPLLHPKLEKSKKKQKEWLNWFFLFLRPP